MKRHRHFPMSVLAVALLAGCGTSRTAVPAPTPEAPLRGLDAYIERAVDDWDIAGLAIAVVKDDSVVFAEGYGVREMGRPEPVDPTTLFAIGSNTKLFTAVAAGMMVDDGRMQWDDPATLHLTGFRLHDPYVTREITIRDLLSHRSGLGRRGDLLWYGTEYDREEVLRRIRFLEPNSSFRSEYGYQNIMFLAAGQAVASVAGMRWDAVIERRIFEPLGMTASNTSVGELPRRGNVATPHSAGEDGPVPIPWRNIDNVAPAGSINSSAIDMAQWLRMLLDNGSYAGRELIESATLAEITSPQTILPFPPDTLFPSTHFTTYGLGVVLQDYLGETIAWHTGGIDGMLSLVGFVPDENLGVVVLTNTDGRNNLYTALMYRIFDAYLGAPPRDWSTIFLSRTRDAQARADSLQGAREGARVAGTRPSLGLEGFAGRYQHEMYGEASVQVEDGVLVLRFGPAFTGELRHWHYDTFRAEWGAESQGTSLVTFVLDASGKVEEMRVEGVANFQRVEPEESL